VGSRGAIAGQTLKAVAVIPPRVMYDDILLPTDGNPQTPQVAEHALNVAELADATLHVVAVQTEDLDDGEGQEAVDAVDELADERGVPTSTTVLEGRPSETILDYVGDAGVDMVVMGTHGRSGLDRMLLGSVTERVLRLSDVPVLTVRLTEGARRVQDAEDAEGVARKALEREGYEVAGFPEQPYREAHTWIVRAETAGGERFNVHVDASSGDARLAKIRS
jgi:nucleotide-binding universal stress UspA family protein